MIAAIALASRGDDDPGSPHARKPPRRPRPARPRPRSRRPPRPPRPSRRLRPSPRRPHRAPPAGGAPDLDAARALQLEGYNARRAGDFQTALDKARAAQQACGGSKELSPCGYAVFEEGAALVGLGQPEAAIPIFERRLSEFGDNENREVEKALRKALRDAGEGR